MALEDPVIDPSSLTKFSKLRMKDINLLELIIEQNILKSNSIIIGTTHLKARYNQKTPQEITQDLARKLRKAVYTMDELAKAKCRQRIQRDAFNDILGE